MPYVYPKIVSFSSEDENNPADNLIKKGDFRRWKCKTPGEAEAYVIFQFEQATKFSIINVGNNGSGLIEIQVARSGPELPKFEVLLPAVALSDAEKARKGEGLREVKFLKQFDTTVANEKWDLVKVILSQPFNKHIQYGLSFITFSTPSDEPKSIGGFAFKTDAGPSVDLSAGSLFAKLKKDEKAKDEDDGVPTKSVASEIRSATVTPSYSNSSSGAKVDSSRKRKLFDDDDDDEEEDKPLPRRNLDISTPSSSQKKPTPSSSQGSSNASSSVPSKAPRVKPPGKKQIKPFKKLFEGVTFVLSGFQNPSRAVIRDKGLAMGAKYKPDWNSTCTHLICAFRNTPKFFEVQNDPNGGKIVRKDWIEDSFEAKVRFPWRRYCLDRNDQGSESEDEIYSEETAKSQGSQKEDKKEEEKKKEEEEDEEVLESGAGGRGYRGERKVENDEEDDYDKNTDVDEAEGEKANVEEENSDSNGTVELDKKGKNGEEELDGEEVPTSEN